MAIDWAAAVVVAGVFAATLGLTGAVRQWLGRRAILDRPGHRSSHARRCRAAAGSPWSPCCSPAGSSWRSSARRRRALASSSRPLSCSRWSPGGTICGPAGGSGLAAHAVAAIIGVAWLPPSAKCSRACCRPCSTAPPRPCSGCGSSISTISWTGSTASPASRPPASASASPWSLGCAGANGDGTAALALARPRRRWAFCAGTGIPRRSFSAMSAACRSAISWAGCCWSSPGKGCGRRR